MSEKKMKIIFIGTGPSSGVPNLHCLKHGGCSVCLSSNNNRTNVSILIIKEKPLLIDCTKDFKYQYEKCLLKQIRQKTMNDNIKFENLDRGEESNSYTENIPNNNINETDAQFLSIENVLITHEHADAILGLDSLKQTLQNSETCNIYADKVTSDYLRNNYNYLFHKGSFSFSPGSLVLNTIEDQKEYSIAEYNIKPFYVLHGKLYSFAYLIDKKVLYVSDCSKFDLDIEAEILIIECTTKDKSIRGHLNFIDVLSAIERVKPRITYVVGMSHLVDYTEFKEYVEKFDKNIIVAYDMMEVEF